MNNPISAGDVFESRIGSSCTVIKRVDRKTGFLVRFNDDNGHEMTVQASGLRRGSFKNPYYPSVSGVGFVGVGEFSSRINGERYAAYESWCSMLQRCYSDKFHARNPTYKGCQVDSQWHNLQDFAKWYVGNKYNIHGYQLDKDILVEGNRVYSPEFCHLVPSQINSLILNGTGLEANVFQCKSTKLYTAYMVKGDRFGSVIGKFDSLEEAELEYYLAKNKHIRSKALEFRGRIDDDVLEVLIEWDVRERNIKKHKEQK